MKQFKNIVISLLIITGTVVFLIEIILSGEKPKSEFSNYSEAKASGLMGRGWIPTFIPRSAAEIREQHDLDRNWVKMSFNYDVGDLEKTRAECVSEKYFKGGVEFDCEYFSNKVSIKLYSNGEAELHSLPITEINKGN